MHPFEMYWRMDRGVTVVWYLGQYRVCLVNIYTNTNNSADTYNKAKRVDKMYKFKIKKKKTFNNILKVIARGRWTKQKWCIDVTTRCATLCGQVAVVLLIS